MQINNEGVSTHAMLYSLQWHHNERDSGSNHRGLDCLLNRLFRRRSKKTSKLCVIGLCEGNLPVTIGFPLQRASARKIFQFDDVIMICSHMESQDGLQDTELLGILFSNKMCTSPFLYFLSQWVNVILYESILRMITSRARDNGLMAHYNDVTMTTMASQITSLTVVYSTVYSDADQRKHQSSASLAFTNDKLHGKWFHLMTSSCILLKTFTWIGCQRSITSCLHQAEVAKQILEVQRTDWNLFNLQQLLHGHRVTVWLPGTRELVHHRGASCIHLNTISRELIVNGEFWGMSSLGRSGKTDTRSLTHWSQCV